MKASYFFGQRGEGRRTYGGQGRRRWVIYDSTEVRGGRKEKRSARVLIGEREGMDPSPTIKGQSRKERKKPGWFDF